MIPRLAISHFALGQKFRLLVEQKLRPILDKMQSVRIIPLFYLITLFAPTPFIRMNWFVKMKRAPHLHLEWIESWGLGVLSDKSWLRSCDELFHCGNGIGRFEINPRQDLTRSKRWRRATGTTWSGSCHNQEHGHMCGNVRWDEYTSFEKYQF